MRVGDGPVSKCHQYKGGTLLLTDFNLLCHRTAIISPLPLWMLHMNVPASFAWVRFSNTYHDFNPDHRYSPSMTPWTWRRKENRKRVKRKNNVLILLGTQSTNVVARPVSASSVPASSPTLSSRQSIGYDKIKAASHGLYTHHKLGKPERSPNR